MKEIIRMLAFITAAAIALVMLSGCAEGGKNARDSELAGLSAGQRIYFGSYPQSSSEPEPIEWRVLDVRDGRALLLSEKVLDCHVYDKKLRDTTWEGCSLRQWMNKDFMDTAFSDAEKESVVEVTNPNPAPPEQGDTGALFAEGGADTVDRVFCLSYDEAVRYFSDSADLPAEATAYAVGRGAFVLDTDGQYGEWWLRTQGYDNKWAMYVKFFGMIDTDGRGVDTGDIGVRPAMWVTYSAAP